MYKLWGADALLRDFDGAIQNILSPHSFQRGPGCGVCKIKTGCDANAFRKTGSRGAWLSFENCLLQIRPALHFRNKEACPDKGSKLSSFDDAKRHPSEFGLKDPVNLQSKRFLVKRHTEHPDPGSWSVMIQSSADLNSLSSEIERRASRTLHVKSTSSVREAIAARERWQVLS